jgi:hypothetical protein
LGATSIEEALTHSVEHQHWQESFCGAFGNQTAFSGAHSCTVTLIDCAEEGADDLAVGDDLAGGDSFTVEIHG